MTAPDEAGVAIEELLARVRPRLALPGAVVAERVEELHSHLAEAALARATARGSRAPSRADVYEAFSAFGSAARAARSFSTSLQRPVAASLARRAAAYILDYLLIRALLTFPLLLAVSPLVEGPGDFVTLPWWARLMFAVAALSDFIVILVSAGLEWRFGATVGKRLLNLRALRTSGEPLSFRQALARNATKLPPILLVDTAIAGLLRARGQRLADRRLGTVVARAAADGGE